MKLKDIEDFEVLLALYTISHCADGMFDEVDEDDLPDALCSDKERAANPRALARG